MSASRIYEILEELKILPVIRVENLIRRGYTRSSAEALLSRLHNRGLIRRIKKGIYTMRKDPLDYLTSIETPSYISFEYAASFYGLTSQVPMKYTLATTRRVREIECPEISLYVEYVRIPNWLFFGWTKVRGSLIATPEKTVIDCIYKLRCPMDEIRNHKYEWNLKRVKEYLRYVKSRWLRKKVEEFFF